MKELARCPSLVSGLCGSGMLRVGGSELVAQLMGPEGLIVVVLVDPVLRCYAEYLSLNLDISFEEVHIRIRHIRVSL